MTYDPVERDERPGDVVDVDVESEVPFDAPRRSRGDQVDVRGAIMRCATAAHPGALERRDLDTEPEIARADGRTVQGEIRRLVNCGCLTVIDTELPSGRALRFQASTAAATAVQAVLAVRR